MTDATVTQAYLRKELIAAIYDGQDGDWTPHETADEIMLIFARHRTRAAEDIPVMKGRCEDCCLLDIGSSPFTATCNADRPENVDYRWDRSEIPVGRFISEIDYLRPCILYQGPVDTAEMTRRADFAEQYIDHLAKDGKWVNRFARALPVEATDADT